MNGSREVALIGLDFGTTTSSAVVATGFLERCWASGRTDLAGIKERHRSEIVLTPFHGDAIDVERAGQLLDGWLAAAGVSAEGIFGGGAIITGLAARRKNAAHLARLIRARIGDAVMAIADDPCLESWMAFMGGAVELSRARPETPVMNIDIGGGTTNFALGLGGDVIRVGCLFVGARHVEVTPGTYRLTRLSEQARAVFDHLGVPKREGDILEPEEVRAIVGFQVDLIQGEVEGREEPSATSIPTDHRSASAIALGARLRQVALRLPSGLPRAALTFSGGVGELIYHSLRGEALPEPTHYGDLGIDLARRIVASRCLMRDVLVPASTGRATSYGLLCHSTQVSGATLFLPHPEVLPLADIPILRRLSSAAPALEIESAVELARRSARGGCIQIRYEGRGPEALKDLGQRISSALSGWSFSRERPLVILLSEDVGKALGGFITHWGRAPTNILVIDEIAPRDAQFVQIGRAHGDVVPVSFYGMSSRREAP